MSKEQVLNDLSRLLDEVDSLPLDAPERQRLHGLISDVEQHLDDEVESPAELDIVDTVEELATRLETDHPAFIGILRRVMNTLSSMGV
ncbi:MAG: DUF4404 family protein [Pseudomonadota bacterium]